MAKKVYNIVIRKYVSGSWLPRYNFNYIKLYLLLQLLNYTYVRLVHPTCASVENVSLK